MAMRFLCLLVLAAATGLEPCRGLPVDERGQALERWEKESRERSGSSDDICLLCQGAVNILKTYLEENTSVDKLFPVLEPMCLYFMEKVHGYNGPYMCPGIIHAYAPVLLYVFAEGALKPSDLCYLFHLCNKTSSSLPHTAQLPVLSEVIHGAGRGGVDHIKKKREKASSLRGRRKSATSSGGERTRDGDTIIFLHFSDIHLDRDYSEGSPTNCLLYLCCRRWYNGTGQAGHYGDYSCDLPLATLDLVVETIATLDPQPDFIIYTGDNSPHDLWNETWTSQLGYSQFLFSYLAQKLPGRRIYPAIGNHETCPESEYIGTLPQYQELTKKLAQYWSDVVPLPQSALDTISEGGYYTLLIRDKLRLLSFNSDYGYSTNFYSRLNDQNSHYFIQQKWINATLHQAEQDGEKVIVIAHVPPGDPGNTLHTYEEFYLNLTRRYHNTIVGHLFGHTHHDQFTLIQDEDGVYGTLMMSPSVTPQGRSNPSFRIFSMNATTYQLLGYQQYHLNLTLANELASKGMKPKMELVYTTSDHYQLPDLSPTSWADLVERFADYPDLVSDYLYNKYGQSSSQDKSCDPDCVHDTICRVSNILNVQRAKCVSRP